MLNYGIRSGGIGDFTTFITLDDLRYWSHFFFEMLFFFTIILIMMNVINGIIVDTFQELREENNLKAYDQQNVCYICGLNRSNFEILGLKFEEHNQIDHNLKNYILFLLKIHLTDEHDLNSLDFFVLNAFRNKRLDFFPIMRCLSMKNI